MDIDKFDKWFEAGYQAGYRAALASQEAVPPAAVPAHPDDAAVDRFAVAMKEKMAASRAKGRGGWDDPAQCRVEKLAAMLVQHVEKGDPVDIANFAMMIHQRGGTAIDVYEAQAVDASMLQRAADALNGQMCKGSCDGEICCMPKVRASRDELRAALAAQPAAPAGEPVAWLESEESARRTPIKEVMRGMFHTAVWHFSERPQTSNPVWTLHAPVANAGQALTREQVWAAFSSIPDIPDVLYAQVKHFLKNCKAPSWQAKAVAVPDGWRLVPVEPTEEMQHVADRYDVFDVVRPAAHVVIKALWSDMLAASPLPQQPEKYLTAAQAAAAMGICRQRITALCREGRIKGAIKPGQGWLIPEGAVVLAAAKRCPGKVEMKEM